MTPGKSTDDLKGEWSSIAKDWCSVYRWRSLATSAYCEQVAALILQDYEQIGLNVQGLRQSNYAQTGHRGQCDLQTPIAQFTEKRFVRAMYNLAKNKMPSLGHVLDYEVPLKAYESAPHGDIDLLSLHEQSLFIIEAKQHHSKDPILKPMLQAYTYARLVQVVKAQFTRSFGLESSPMLVPVVLSFETAESGKQLMTFGKYPKTGALLKRLDTDLLGLGLGRIEAYICSDGEAALNSCLTAKPNGLGQYIVTFKEGFVATFRRAVL
jgi:hypothetical protein